MRGRFRPPALAVAAALLGLIALLGSLQYRWLGRISDAEREQMTATLNARATAFALDFDRELTLAYMLFQVDPGLPGVAPEQSLPTRIASRYERWQATARYPKLIRTVYFASRDGSGATSLQQFDPGARSVSPVEWPESLAPIRAQLTETREEKTANGAMVVRAMTSPVWEQVPALVVPNAFAPLVMLSPQSLHATGGLPAPASISYTVLALDRALIGDELLPALARHHFPESSDAVRYQIAVVESSAARLVYQSTPEFTPGIDPRSDATADLFQVRPQEFPQVAADVRRFMALSGPSGLPGATFTTFSMPVDRHPAKPDQHRAPAELSSQTVSQLIVRDQQPGALGAGQAAQVRDRTWVAALTGTRSASAPRWRLLIKHPAGSLAAAVDSGRRRNLLVSMGILGVLAASMMLMVVSLRRAQELARQQMEFVTTVSHELRTPLAVVRAAGDNLADGVIHEEEQVRKYGELVRNEGRRLTEMVEQILEFAGIHSGQRTLNLTPVRVEEVIDSVLRASAPLIESARLDVQVHIPADLPPVAGDESALRRVFQNLVGNAIKYGAEGGWIGIDARRSGSDVLVTVSDRGIGIAPADQERIFEPFYRAADVVSAQIQGAGLGLSLVQRIVQAHGGRITVRSAVASGSQFTVSLPAGAEQSAAEPSTAGADAAAPASRLS